VPVNSLFTSDHSTRLEADRPVVVERAMYWGGRTDGHVSMGITSPSTSWYLAEGTTAWGFEEYLLVQNPNPEGATVRLTFMFPNGKTQTRIYPLPPTSRLTVPVNSLFTSDHSTRLEADRPVVVERAMYWGGRDGGHASAAVKYPSRTWFLAEGSTAWGFEEYILVQNPNPEGVRIKVDFLRPEGGTVKREFYLSGNSRWTIRVSDHLGSSDHSTRLEADRPVVVERAMYWQAAGRQRAGGHCEAGSPVLARTWYLAEGSTAWGFEEYILVANPREELAEVKLVFQRPDGKERHYSLKVPEKSRRTILANRVDAGKDASILVSSNVPVLAERAMYWSGKEGGTVGMGALSP